MKEERMKTKFNDGWAFAIVNGRFAEIHFNKKYGPWGHCYVNKEEYKTKQEQKWIKEDTQKYQFSYRSGYYFDKIRKIRFKIPSRQKLFSDSIKKSSKNLTLEQLKRKLKLL